MSDDSTSSDSEESTPSALDPVIAAAVAQADMLSCALLVCTTLLWAKWYNLTDSAWLATFLGAVRAILKLSEMRCNCGGSTGWWKGVNRS